MAAPVSRLVVGLLVWACLLLLPPPTVAQSYGLAARAPIGPYLDGRLPSTNPGGGGTWGTTLAFNLTFQSPIKMVPEPRSNRLWVIGREGHVYWFENDPAVTTRTLALDLSAQTQGWGDCGLLGIALHPEFGQAGSPNRGYLYVYYNFSPAPITGVEPSGTPSYDRLSRFTLADGASTIDPASEVVLINQFDEFAWHNGGDMYFGPDGFLYLTNGDEGGSNDVFGNSQTITNGLFGGVLRLDVDRDPARSHAIRRQPQVGGVPPPGWPATYSQGYFIPNDNPWQDPAGSVLEEFWAIGLRSPHRMSFDPESGTTFIGDIGEEQMEEIDVLARGANFQWPYREGIAAGPKGQPSPLRGADTPPFYAYGRQEGDTAVIVGRVYRGAEFADVLGGKFIFGDFSSGRIFAMTWDQGSPTTIQLTSVPAGTKWQGLSGFGYDQNNELYIMALGEEGRVLKLTRTNTNVQPPATLSATGAFSDLATLTPAPGIVPYDVNSPLWSDGAVKARWIALPNDGAPYSSNESVLFAENGPWRFPEGTVFIKHFELPVDARNPTLVKRLETRLLVREHSGSAYGITYKWRADGSDADLLPGSLSEDIPVTAADGTTSLQTWSYPSRENCQLCHTPAAGFVLGVKTAQLNGPFLYPSTGLSDNQLRTWAQIGMFLDPPAEGDLASLSKMVRVDHATASLETRARSYLDANCAHCHRPNGVRGNWDGRFETPLAQQNIVNGLVNDSLGILGARVVAPGHIEQSIAYLRLGALDRIKMPPLAKNVVHDSAVAVLGQWINSLNGGGIPPPWVGHDVGLPVLGGLESYADGAFTISGSGADIYDSSDQFHFLSQPITGDGEIIARIASQTATHSWAKAGVMFRETLDSGSRHALMLLAPVGMYSLHWRSTTGGGTGDSSVPADPAPNNWVRLVRQGDVLTGYSSADGVSWSQVAAVNVAMAPSIEVGLVVCSHDTSVLGRAVFDHVQVNDAQPPPVPTVSLSLQNGPAYTAPADVSLLASVNANGTTITKVEFLSGSTVLGEASAAPYEYVWPQVGAGSYTLAARVTTSTGQTATSSTVSVTVDPPPPDPTISLALPDGPDYAAPAHVSLTATVEATGYTVSKVQFLSGSTVLGEVTAPPYAYTWSDLPVGTYAVFARLITTSNRTVDSSPVQANVLPALTAAGWTTQDIGSVTTAGDASLSADVFTLHGAGTGIGSLSDQVRYAWQQLTGDGEIVARLVPPTKPDTLAKAAVMIRASLQPNSREALLVQTGTGAGGFQYRATDGGRIATVLAPATTNSYRWLRLVRNGTRLTAFRSPTGVTWTQIASVNLALPGAVQIGLAVTSSRPAILSAAAFDHVRVTPSTLPAPWEGGEIGATRLSVLDQYAAGAYTVQASGVGFATGADQCKYLSQPLTGDGEIVARVVSQTNTGAAAVAGVMIRDGLSPRANCVAMTLSPGSGFTTWWRRVVGGAVGRGPVAKATGAQSWVRLVRSGDTITSYRSADGQSWTQTQTLTLKLSSAARIGLVVAAGNNVKLGTAVFSDVQATP